VGRRRPQSAREGRGCKFQHQGRPGTATADWEYLYHGHLIPGWPKPPDVNAVDQRPALVGCVLRTKPHGAAPAWYVAPFIAVKRQPPFTSELSGSWIYRSFNPTFVEGDQTAPQERQLIVADGVFKLETPTSTTLKGALEGPGWFLDLLNGRVQPDALGYETSSFEIVGTGRPDTYTAGWEYHYHGHLTRWPDHIDDRPPLVGSVFRAKTHNGVPPRSPAGEVFSFIAVKQP
jgi:hypothetical protein